jgi:hypothetical protein
MLFEGGDRVRVTRDYNDIPKGAEGIVAGLDLDAQTYSVALLDRAQPQAGIHEIPPEFLEVVEQG